MGWSIRAAVAVLAMMPAAAFAQGAETPRAEVSLSYWHSEDSFRDQTGESSVAVLGLSLFAPTVTHTLSFAVSDEESSDIPAARSSDKEILAVSYAAAIPLGPQGLVGRAGISIGSGDLTAADGGAPETVDLATASAFIGVTQSIPILSQQALVVDARLIGSHIDGDMVAGANPSRDQASAWVSVRFLSAIGRFSHAGIGLSGMVSDGPVTPADDESRLDATLSYGFRPDPASGVRFGISASTNLTGDYSENRFGVFIANRF